MGPWEKKNGAVTWLVRRQGEGTLFTENFACYIGGTKVRSGAYEAFLKFSLGQTEGNGFCSELKMELMNELILRVVQF